MRAEVRGCGGEDQSMRCASSVERRKSPGGPLEHVEYAECESLRSAFLRLG